MKITNKLKRRFCKDNGIPIKIYDEPYFTHMLKLFNGTFDTINKYENFKKYLLKYNSEEDFFTNINKIENEIITHIKSKKAYQDFINMDMNKFNCMYQISNENFYSSQHSNHNFLSIDLSNANFTSLKYVDSDIIDNKKTYYDFIKQFTEDEYFLNSKQIRQIIFGKLNPKRQNRVQKFIMDLVLIEVLNFTNIDNIVSIVNDEIIIKYNEFYKDDLLIKIKELERKIGCKFHYEEFTLKKFKDFKFYIKIFKNGDVKFKCINALYYPTILREYYNEPPHIYDRTFIHENIYCNMLQTPKYGIKELLEYE